MTMTSNQVRYSGLDEPLIPQTQAYAEVVAPSTLPGGYTFEAEVGGRTFPVTVPAGGVHAGQRFKAPVPSSGVGGLKGASESPGSWKDGLCSCFNPGVCHPSVCLAIWCPLVLVGQIMNRLKMPVPCGGVRALLAISVVYFVVQLIISSWSASLQAQAGRNMVPPPPGPALDVAEGILGLIFALAVLVLLFQARIRVRDRDGIPGGTCRDCCCSLWCSCCVLSQMARQTADYAEQKADWCGETGLSADAGV